MGQLAAVVAGLFLLLVMLSTLTLLTPLAAVLREAPIPFAGSLADWIIGAQARAQASVAGLAANGLDGLTSTWHQIYDRAEGWLAAERGLLGALAAALQRIALSTIPTALQTALGYAYQLWQNAEQGLHQVENAALGAVGALESKLEAELSGAWGGLRAWAAGELSGLASWASGEISQAEAMARADVAAVEREAVGLAQAETSRAQAAEQVIAGWLEGEAGRLESEVSAVAQFAEQAAAQAEARAEGELEQVGTALRAELAGLGSDVEQRFDAILQGIPWGSLAARVGVGEDVLRADASTLILAGLQEIKKEIADVDALRKRYGPVVAEHLAKLKAAV